MAIIIANRAKIHLNGLATQLSNYDTIIGITKYVPIMSYVYHK